MPVRPSPDKPSGQEDPTRLAIAHIVAQQDGTLPAALNAWQAAAIALLSLLALFPLHGAHGALDRVRPDEATATRMLLFALVAAAGAVAASTYLLSRRRQWLGIGLGFGMAPLTWLPAMLFVSDYGYARASVDWTGGQQLAITILAGLFVLCALAAAVSSFTSRQAGAQVAASFGVATGTGIVLAAAYMLLTLDEQAAEAARANQPAPAAGILVAGLVLGAAALRRRAGR